MAKKSSFLQSIFNSINILIGVGILALPLGFKVKYMPAVGIWEIRACCGILTRYTHRMLVGPLVWLCLSFVLVLPITLLNY